MLNSQDIRAAYRLIRRKLVSQTSGPAHADNKADNKEVNVRDREFWQRYLNSERKSSLPFTEIAFQRYRIDHERVVFSMLSIFELATIYALGRDYWSGSGAIVDLGCLYGLTTRCFAKGVAHNNTVQDSQKNKVIYAFDLFLAAPLWPYAVPSATVHTGSTFPDFLLTTEDLSQYIVPCPGDLAQMNWSIPIEVLFIDCAKSWELNGWVLQHMFPCLQEGSIVVQQDYIHYNEYWLHITMEYFADYFEPLYMMTGGSSVYRCKRAIDVEQTRVDLASMPLADKEAMLVQAMSKAPPSVREVLKCGYAKCLLEYGEISRARSMIESVYTEPLTEDPVLEVAVIAASNKAVVQQMITAAGG